MSEVYESIKRGLEQAIAYTNGDTSQCRIHHPKPREDNGDWPKKVFLIPVKADESNISRDKLRCVDDFVANVQGITLLRHGLTTLFVNIDDAPHGEKMMIVNGEQFPLEETSESGLFKIVGLSYYKLIKKTQNQDNNVITLNVISDEN